MAKANYDERIIIYNEWRQGRVTMSKVAKKKLKLKMKTLKEENLYKKMELNTQRNWEPLFKQGKINYKRKSKCCKWTAANIFNNDSSIIICSN